MSNQIYPSQVRFSGISLKGMSCTVNCNASFLNCYGAKNIYYEGVGAPVSLKPSKSVLGSTLPSGLIVRLSGSCALTGNARIERETMRHTVTKAMQAFMCYQKQSWSFLFIGIFVKKSWLSIKWKPAVLVKLYWLSSAICFIEPWPRTCFSEGLWWWRRWRRWCWQCSCFHRIVVKCYGYWEDWCYERRQNAWNKGADYAKWRGD